MTVEVVCTAGHVDHGKSTLVRALTGMEPDRLEEERARGLTIDIGYAWTDLDGTPTAFVDLPGHERFIANMLAGAGAVRRALFVVAADEGWMPQSAEHLTILDLLGIEAGVVAVTRTDLVDAETRALAVHLVREELADSVLARAPIVPVSAVTGEGVDAVRSALVELVARSPDSRAPAPVGRARLWIDRSFTVAGAGTVVTGTLTGTLRTGDRVAFGPGRRGVEATARVRGLQQLRTEVDAAGPGRVAVNLAAVATDEVRRGAAVTTGPWQRTARVEAWLRGTGDRPLRRRGSWHLHVGSAERVVQLAPFGGDIGVGGGFAQLSFDGPLPLEPGDRFVLREAGARETVGGGIVVDVAPGPRPRGRRDRSVRMGHLAQRRDVLERPSDAAGAPRGALARVVLDEQRIVAHDALLRLTGVAAAPGGTDVVTIGPLLAARTAVDALAAALTAALAAHHAAHPMTPGAPRGECLTALVAAGCPPPHATAVLDHLVGSGVVVTAGPAVRLPGHEIRLDAAAQAVRAGILEQLDASPFAPPAVDAVLAACGADEDFLRTLEHTGDIVRLRDRVVMTSAAVADAEQRLRRLHREAGPFTAAEARAALDTTRKYVIPLLEELDRRGVTRRIGDRRAVT